MFGIGNRNESQDVERFWRKYGARYGETIHAYGLGRYISGWAEFQDTLWGLLIATSGGCRFYHFPHKGWIQVCSCISFDGDAPREKTLFIPHERILDVNLWIEKSWWKRLLIPSLPHIMIRYRPGGALAGRGDPDGQGLAGNTLVIECEWNIEKIVRYLSKPADI
jgi:hypothetical protein